MCTSITSIAPETTSKFSLMSTSCPIKEDANTHQERPRSSLPPESIYTEEEQIRQLNDIIADHLRTIAVASTEINSLYEELDAKDAEIGDLTEKLDALQIQHTILIEEHNKCSRMKETRDDLNNDLHTQRNSVGQDVKTLQHIALQLTDSKTQTSLKFDSDNDKLHLENDALLAQSSILQSDYQQEKQLLSEAQVVRCEPSISHAVPNKRDIHDSINESNLNPAEKPLLKDQADQCKQHKTIIVGLMIVVVFLSGLLMFTSSASLNKKQ